MLHVPNNRPGTNYDFRDYHNPLRGLDIRKSVQLLEAWRRGDTTEYLWTIDLIRGLFTCLRGALRSVLDGVEEFDWEIKMIPDKKMGASQKAMAQRQYDTLRAEYERIDNLQAAIRHASLHDYYGNAFMEIWRDSAGGDILHLECVPAWHFHRKSASAPWLYDANATLGGQDGVPLPMEDWLILHSEDPVGPIALLAYVARQLAKIDWSGYTATYGIPFRWATLPENVEEKDLPFYLSLIEKAISGASGALPAGCEVKVATVSNGGGGNSPFHEQLDYEDQQISMAVMSSHLTMMAESGSGTLAGNAHADSLQRAIRGLAKRVSTAFSTKLDADILARKHPGEPKLAWWSISYLQQATGDEFLDSAKKANDLGYQVDPDQVAERTDLQLLPHPGKLLADAFKADPTIPTAGQ